MNRKSREMTGGAEVVLRESGVVTVPKTRATKEGERTVLRKFRVSGTHKNTRRRVISLMLTGIYTELQTGDFLKLKIVS